MAKHLIAAAGVFTDKALVRVHGEAFLPELQCFVKSHSYDFESRTLTIWLYELECVDMSGAINLAKRIDPRARKIITRYNNRLDTTYVRKGGGWQAVAPNETEFG